MKPNVILAVSLFFLFTSLPLQAEVQRSQFTTEVISHEPVDNISTGVIGANDEFKTFFFYTHITNMAGENIVHRWLYQGNEMAAVTLNIGGDSWRTYSSKRILPRWKGEWEVQVWHQDLQIMSQTFTVVTE